MSSEDPDEKRRHTVTGTPEEETPTDLEDKSTIEISRSVDAVPISTTESTLRESRTKLWKLVKEANETEESRILSSLKSKVDTKLHKLHKGKPVISTLEGETMSENLNQSLPSTESNKSRVDEFESTSTIDAPDPELSKLAEETARLRSKLMGKKKSKSPNKKKP